MTHNHDWATTLLTFAIDESADVVAAVTPGTVKGIVKKDNKVLSGAEIKIGDTVWGTTDANGAFSFDIAPGSHSFDVVVGGKTKKSFDATATAGEETDAGDIKYKTESDDTPGFGLVIAALAFLAVAGMATRRRF
jgi:PGF-CTERM protein